MSLTDKINEALRHPDPFWAYHQCLGAHGREHMDALIVERKMPLGFEPGTNWNRFRQLHAAKHQF